ncbi:CsbD family protein [Paenarthrobacter aurescens]|uniref:CsbD family protein n=1 Tax=Paenarthrobacter aurescens TaxID=43663 RepID=UPI0021BFAFFA|nr:CsbD family protein [Paenarthrobacter aurescens]MCT9869861.1 CsbD family protein [Paenarthrobacter aurescens]
MGLGDKIKNAAEEATGKVKEKTGEATGDRDLQAEGLADQSNANLKQAGEKVKDAAKDVKDSFKGH